MKKLICTVVLSSALVLSYSAAALASEGTTVVVKTEAQEKAGITPDSMLYPVERLVESVNVALTFSEEGKAKLLVEFADERLAEAEIMTEKNRLELVEQVMQAYTKYIKSANEKVAKACKKEKDVRGLVEKIEVIQGNADKVVIEVSAKIPQEVTAQIEEAITAETQKILVTKAFLTAKENFKEAKVEFEAAKDAHKLAKTSNDPTAVRVTFEKMQQAEQYKDQMEKLKDEVEFYKEQIKEDLQVTKQGPKEKSKASNKNHKFAEKLKKQQEKAEEKRAKAEKKLEKKAEHEQSKLKKKAEQAKKKLEREQVKVKYVTDDDHGRNYRGWDDDREDDDDRNDYRHEK